MFQFFKNNKDLGLLLFRLFIGTRLIYGVIDNIVDSDRMLEFEVFLKAFRFPLPKVSAFLSVYFQAIAGLLYTIGYKIRWAAITMIINFLVAIIMVHMSQTFEEMTPALAMLFASMLFLFTGAGIFSLDKESLVNKAISA